MPRVVVLVLKVRYECSLLRGASGVSKWRAAVDVYVCVEVTAMCSSHTDEAVAKRR